MNWDQPHDLATVSEGYSTAIDNHPLVNPWVLDIDPACDFVANTTVVETGLDVGFIFTGNPGNTPHQSITWNFGDGTPNANGQFATHAYASPGLYDVDAWVIDLNGDSDSATKTRFIRAYENVLPDANFSVNLTRIDAGEQVLFNWTGSTPNDPATFQWDFGDGTPNATSSTSSHVYTNAGNYTVTLTVTDVVGNSSTIVKPFLITVNGIDPPGGGENPFWTHVFPWLVVGATGLVVVVILGLSRARKKQIPAV